MKRLLIITQKVDRDDDLLGFFHAWIRELAARVDRVTVICLFEGAHELPANVRVHSLGKESGVSRVKYLRRFFVLVWKKRHEYDTVFVHMNPIYLVLAGWLWRMMGKRTALWYVHGHDDTKLRIAAFWAHRIFTAVPQSFPFASPKLRCVGHGIETERFERGAGGLHDGLRMLHVGRLSRSKRIAELAEALDAIAREVPGATLTLVGQPSSAEDTAYVARVRERVGEMDRSSSVFWVGAVPNKEMPALYPAFDMLVHLSSTGGLDKVVIESWCAGTPAFTDQRAFEPFFGEHAPRFILPASDAQTVARSVLQFHRSSDAGSVVADVAGSMRKAFDLRGLVGRLVDELWNGR